MAETIIHILKHGTALCRIEGEPRLWPEGHKWLAFYDTDEIQKHATLICDACWEVHTDGSGDNPEVRDR